ncbi:MAG: hypothetical protein ABID09_00640, partial [Candidatus Omnitrophota bacterium]
MHRITPIKFRDTAVIADFTDSNEDPDFVTLIRKKESGEEYFDFRPTSKKERDKFLQRISALRKEVKEKGTKYDEKRLSAFTKDLGVSIGREIAKETLIERLDNDANLVNEVAEKLAGEKLTEKNVREALRGIGIKLHQ